MKTLEITRSKTVISADFIFTDFLDSGYKITQKTDDKKVKLD